MASWDGVARRALGGICCLAMTLGGCSVVVGGVLDGKGVDGGANGDMTDLGAPDLPASGRCTDDAQCRNTNACDGVERCTDGLCFAGTPPADGTSCDADFNAETRDLCLASRCVASLCGDGFVDAPGEACDDGNSDDGDGCDADCTGSCAVDADCDDSNPCTRDACDASLTCKSTPTPPGMTCGVDGVCMGGACVPAGCGDGVVAGAEECDPPDGAGCTPTCQFECEADADCDDGDVCNGTQTCTLATHGCSAAVALDCADADGCTVDTCSALSGCKHALEDGDGDGFGPPSCGGGDCNDADLNVNPGAPEACNGVDDDCDGAIDDGTMVIDWYVDSDGDGFGHRATSMSSCERPAGFVANADDCYDANANAHPYPRGGSPDFGTDRGDRSFDYDCDGVETQQFGAPNCRDGGGNICVGRSCTGASGVGEDAACGDRTPLLVCVQCRGLTVLVCGTTATTDIILGCH